MTKKFGMSVAKMGSSNDFRSDVSSRSSFVNTLPWGKRESKLKSRGGEEVESCNVNLHEAGFSLLVGGISDNGGWVSSQVMMDHWVEEVLQSSGTWSYHTQGCDGLGLDEL
jgi:hypothetical protein